MLGLYEVMSPSGSIQWMLISWSEQIHPIVIWLHFAATRIVKHANC